MSRKAAREKEYKLIFEYLFLEFPNEITLETLLNEWDLDENDKEYLRSTYTGIIENYEDLIRYVEKYSVKYSTEINVRSDVAIMLIAIYEMKYLGLPVPVAVNEAVNLSKKYSSEKSGAYINGVLASVAKELEAK